MGIVKEEESFGKRLKEIRTKSGVGSRELSKLIGKTDSYVSQIERGAVKKVSFFIGYQLLKQFDMNDEDIIKNLTDYNIKPIAPTEFELLNSYSSINQFNFNNSTKVMEWFDDENQLYKEKNSNINLFLNTFLEKDHSRAKLVIDSLEELLTSDKNTLDFFCEFISYKYIQLTDVEKMELLDFTYKLFISHKKQTNDYKFHN